MRSVARLGPPGAIVCVMGLMARRERKVAERAPAYIEAGETVQAVAMVQTSGIPPEGAARAERKAAKKFTVHAVVATDAAVYLLPVSGLSSIEGILARIPSGEVRIELDRGVACSSPAGVPRPAVRRKGRAGARAVCNERGFGGVGFARDAGRDLGAHRAAAVARGTHRAGTGHLLRDPVFRHVGVAGGEGRPVSALTRFGATDPAAEHGLPAAA